MSAASQAICPNCFTTGYTGQDCQCGYKPEERSPLALPLGTLLNNRYQLGRVLGSGGFGITYLAQDKVGGGFCAVKELFLADIAVRRQDMTVGANSQANNSVLSESIGRFINEARALSRLQNVNNIVQVKEAFRENDTAYYSMEYLDGLNCKQWLRNARNAGGGISWKFSLEVLGAMIDALRAVHAADMLHRDVSLENIFVCLDGTVRLIDFGSVRLLVGERSNNITLALKPGYAPPEQYSSTAAQGPYTDIYALAVSFYHMVSGYLIADAPDRLDGKPVPRLDVLEPSVPLRVAQAIQKAMSLSPAERYADVDSFKADLESRPAPMVETPAPARPAPARLEASLIAMPPAPARPAPARLEPSHKPKPPASARPEPPPDRATQYPELAASPYLTLMLDARPDNTWSLPTDTEITIGRAAGSNVRINLDIVSRPHCVIRYDTSKGSFFVRDRSTNGTFRANGTRISKDGEYLEPGDELYLASPQVRIKVGLQ